MRLPPDCIIAQSKLVKYLLVHQLENDKSAWLATAGYTLENPEILEHDLREQILPQEIAEVQSGLFGEIFIVNGNLRGSNGTVLRIRSIWLKDFLSAQVRFVILYPNKARHEI